MTREHLSPEGARTAFRVTGHGPARVLLLHALTGGPDAADAPGVKGWWGPMFEPGAPLDPDAATVWTPNLAGSCYGAQGPEPRGGWSTRYQAEVLARWIRDEGLTFDALLGGSLGGMVALELAILEPGRFKAVGVIGCGGRSDAWLWGANEAQRAILASPTLGDDEAIALARRVAMLTFRSPDGLGGRFSTPAELQAWLAFHGRALAGRFTRQAYLALLEAMDNHDIGRGRGAMPEALARMGATLHVLGLEGDLLMSRSCLEELIEAAGKAGRLGEARWVRTPHGHDAFLIEWDQVKAWMKEVLP
ncbi:alpha/beta fold hydrolase [Mesoterricola silvestris]|uniref:Homoserine O-acetyltransferase n=1 Tax=Mesoterricola silvestris TaxID=2927979 RepID=A0AA48K6P7_9BACT|nr:alpha/beta fold hydrolase [Mesoterricola silvestris]BDU71044.1 homoserine O-acetyltransferase [Mesoterricola silvestris]